MDIQVENILTNRSIMNVITFKNTPVAPSKIICIGRNYVAHIEELGNEVTAAIPENMVVFNKPNSAIGDVLNSVQLEPLHYEAEMCFLVQNGKFAAVAMGLDLTKRGLQDRLRGKGLPWERCKAFDGSALFSRFVPIEAVSDQLNFTLHIDGKKIQTGNIGLMIYKPQAIWDELHTYTALQDGDIVMTGTPKGVGVVQAGQSFEVKLYDGQALLLSHHWVSV